MKTSQAATALRNAGFRAAPSGTDPRCLHRYARTAGRWVVFVVLSEPLPDGALIQVQLSGHGFVHRWPMRKVPVEQVAAEAADVARVLSEIR